LSFFDDVDDEPVRPPRSAPRGQRSGSRRVSRPPGGRRAGGRPPAGRPPDDQQAIQQRRTIAAVAIVVVVILLALLVHSCDVSSRNSALKDYNTSVYSIIQSSDSTGRNVFAELNSAGSSSAKSNPQNIEEQISQALSSAKSQLQQAEGLSVPSQVQTAQTNLLLALRMRRDGISVIAKEIQPALSATGSGAAVEPIATAMARFYASDVIYKAYVASAIAGALHAAGISVGGTDGQQIAGGQFLNALSWLTPANIASKLQVALPASEQPFTPGLHGHSLNTVSVGSNTMAPGVTNHVAASPAPTFTLNITNGGKFNEFNVVCSVTVKGANDSGSQTIRETTAGEVTNCEVTLSSPVTPGTYQVTAEVAPVKGEQNTANNYKTFTVDFH
jgi:hypothetical protein